MPFKTSTVEEKQAHTGGTSMYFLYFLPPTQGFTNYAGAQLTECSTFTAASLVMAKGNPGGSGKKKQRCFTPG